MTGDQVFTFLVCVSCGLAGGVIYDIFWIVQKLLRARWIRLLCDFAFVVLFGGLYLFVSVMMDLGSVRLYTLLGCLLGLFLYLKSFHKIVAFFCGKVYNRSNSMQKEHRRWRTRAIRKAK